MNHSALRFAAVIALSLAFNFLFWSEKMGLNTLIFTVLYLGALLWFFPESRSARAFWAAAAGTLLAASMVVWHNSGASKLAFVVAAMCAAGFAQVGSMRFVLYALLQYLQSAIMMPRHFFARWGESKPSKEPSRVRKSLGFGLVPVVVVFGFYLLYYAANAKFAALADRFWAQVGRVLSLDISFDQVCFFLFALFAVGGALWRNHSGLAEADAAEPDALLRQRPPRRRYVEQRSMLGLDREFRQSRMLLWLLNGLLLMVNLTDVFSIWFGLDAEMQKDLKGFVHEGTYLLIISILCAMGVLFYVFRRNLNFFPDNNSLKMGAFAWLAQNAVLAISVGIRNAHYVDFHGLAYKRIGVFLFLGLVFFGLYTLWLKIRDRRTMWWLWRRSGWAFFALMLLNACVNWDVLITDYNLSGRPRSTVDVRHMIYQMSSKNLYLLKEKRAQLEAVAAYPAIDASSIASAIEAKERDFWAAQSKLSWKSWNGADARNAR
jgi:hypothetical protein